MTSLDALRAVDFDWAMHLKGVWTDPAHDVPELHQSLRRELVAKLDEMNADADPNSPLGWVIAGSGGTGKTHLLSIYRREALARRVGFVLVDMTDVHDFSETVLLGYLSSLQQTCDGERFQYEVLLEHFIATLKPREPLHEAVRKLRSFKTASLERNTRRVLQVLYQKHRQETNQHQDVIRALIALNSDDFEIASAGLTWLQGHVVEEETSRALGFKKAEKPAAEIVPALSWLMSLVGPTVLAFDQLDPIVSQMNITALAPDAEASDEEFRVAQSIIEGIARGFAALRDVTRRTLTVISCLETTWDSLRQNVMLKPNIDRFEPPRVLRSIPDGDVAASVVRGRLEPAYRKVGFRPPYPTWPFARQAFDRLQGVSPRQILKLCYEHRRRCLARGKVVELTEFGDAGKPMPAAEFSPDRFAEIDRCYATYQQEADPASLLEERADDERLAPLLQAACACLVKESPLPEQVDALVDVDFHGGKTTRALHARLRLVFHDEGDREEHFCLRALQRRHASAFQARLKAAMTQSGIDKKLRFRRLVIVRAEGQPGGNVTQKLVDKLRTSGGLFHRPTESELRALWALKKLNDENAPDFVAWLRSRRPTSQLALMRLAVPALCGNGTPSPQPPTPGEGPSPSAGPAATTVPTPTAPPDKKPKRGKSPEEVPEAEPPAPHASQDVPLGLRLVGNTPGRPVTMPVANLEKHTVVLAGAGSGKTVLVRRMVEEAALLGIPSIVIDGANDLATLGDPWPVPPQLWRDGDVAKAKAYLAHTDVIVWTPGREAGNPLCLEPLPDLTAVADDEDQLNSAVEMARESLREIVAAGRSIAAQNKVGILSAALKFFARQGGGSLEDFVSLLANLPEGAGVGIRNEPRLARDMADRLKAEMAANVLLRVSGVGLDPAILFGDVPGCRKVRISVVNFVGLASLDTQRQFLNQLAMTLFSWIKKHPSPPGRALRGLLVIDEAKDFIPGRSGSVCKASLMRLTAQARKYHLGIVFATQNPREIENTVVGNCSTHYYGKASSPAAINVVREQIRARGGSGDDIPTLEKGRFYVYNADAEMTAPVKVLVPLCLSNHRANPLEEDEILKRAQASRKRLA